MRANIIFILIFFTIFTNCKPQDYESQYAYQNILIPDSLFKFYPNGIDNLKRETYFSSAFKKNNTIIPYYDYTSYSYLKRYNIQNIALFNSYIQSLSKYYIDSINIVKDNYSIIGDQLDIEKQLGDSLNLLNYYNFGKNKILFSFNNIFTESTEIETKCGLNKSYKMYIIMNGYDFVLPQKYYADNTFLPEGYRHGYLSGVAYSIEEQKIIYWTCAW